MKTSLILFTAFCLLIAPGSSRRVILTYNEEKNSMHVQDLEENAVAEEVTIDWIVEIEFHNNVMKNGWATVDISTNPKFNDSMQYYGAGYLEGLVTSEMIGQAWNNTLRGYCDDMSKSCKKIAEFLSKNVEWMLEMAEKNQEDKFWQHVYLGLLQVQGMEDGFNQIGQYDLSIRLKPFGFLLFQLGGDLEDLVTALDVKDHFHKRVLGSGSCSALIKLVETNGQRDLYVAQDTWNDYQSMLRIIKRYNFGSFSESFSSYPGYVFSGDDFYILSSGMVTLETTNGNLNPDLWKFVTPQTVPDWLRNIAANRLARNGEEWCEIFSRYNSGTYNNQWMIVDYNKFNQGDEKGLLTVLEQLPGQIRHADVTDVLKKQSYWASYNVPYFPDIFNATGLPAMVAKFGDWFTHDRNPRARIFARDHKKVTDLETMRNLMRYNDFKNDPFSKCNCTPPYSAENTIAARSDLNPADGVYPFAALGQRDHGATDIKMTSYSLHKSLAMLAECGPTHDQQPVFRWSTSLFASKSHEGQPDAFNFGLEMFTWGK